MLFRKSRSGLILPDRRIVRPGLCDMHILTQHAGFGGGGRNATIFFAGSTTTATDGAAITFSSHAIGTAASNRKVVVAVTTSGGTGADAVSTLTVGGISASLVKATLTTDHTQVELWQADVPTGTTADIVVTWAASKNRTGIAVWAIYNAKSAANDTGTDTSTGTSATSDTLNIPAGGVAIGAIAQSGNQTSTWAGLTEDYDDAQVESILKQSGSSDAFAAIQAGLTISATPAASMSFQAMSLASWGPA